MDISFKHFRKQVDFDDSAITYGERAKWFLFYVTKLVQFRDDMTIEVIKQRLHDLGYECTIEEIREHFSRDSDIRRSHKRSNAYEIKPTAIDNIVKYLSRGRKVFLSHRGQDKPLVRRIGSALDAAGCTIWFDEASLRAGDLLHRSLMYGMRESCAAVFFITPAFTDSTYLSLEIDYAVEEKLKRDKRFQIISIVISSSPGEIGIVPDILRRYVYKQSNSEAEIVAEIIKSLPIRIGVTGWRDE